jgi:hypothetical protein
MADKPEKTEAKVEVEEEEERPEPVVKGYEAPALYCDTFVIQYWKERLRLSLAEWIGPEKYVRAVAFLPMETAQELAKALEEIIAEMKATKKD